MLTWELLGQACLSLKSTSRFLADWSLSLSWLINSKLLLLSVEADAGGSPLQDRAVLWSLLVIGGGRWAPTQQLLGSQCSPAPLLTHSLLLLLDLSCLFWFLSYIKLLHILKLSETWVAYWLLSYMLRSYNIIYIKDICGLLLAQLLSSRCESSGTWRRPGALSWRPLHDDSSSDFSLLFVLSCMTLETDNGTKTTSL